jgi:hypothetical protein
MKSIIGIGLMGVGTYIAFNALSHYGFGFDHLVERAMITLTVLGFFKVGEFVLNIGE